ncbi:MAG TPA: TerC family protein [Gemmatimonadales bacterium]|nr:TerC family protein [Gemmatimonadales bacterium]
MTSHGPAVWLGFTALVIALLVIDLGVLNRRGHVLSMKEAGSWSAGLVCLALLFGGFLWWREGSAHALEYLTGYLIELSLSVDNLFVFILIFQYFSVPAIAQPKVLKWGILGAIVLRGVMIAIGAILLHRFHWIIYVFGGILVFTGIRMLLSDGKEIHPEKNPVVRLAKRVLPIEPGYDEDRFTCRNVQGKLFFTPLILVIIMVEWSDLVFAIDSIPAIFAVTNDPFLVYSSNVFAILGLRALYFVLAGAMDRFHYLKAGISAILIFIGIKMAVSGWYKLPTLAALAVILAVLGIAVAASLLRPRETVAPATD